MNMPKSLEEKIHEIELALADIKGDIKVILNDLTDHKELDKRVRALEDYKNKVWGASIIIAGLISAIVSIIVKLI